MFCFSSSLYGPLPEKAQSALIGQLSQAWASTALYVSPSALPLLGAVTVWLWHHNLLNMLTACLKDQCLNYRLCASLCGCSVYNQRRQKNVLLYGQTTRQQISILWSIKSYSSRHWYLKGRGKEEQQTCTCVSSSVLCSVHESHHHFLHLSVSCAFDPRPVCLCVMLPNKVLKPLRVWMNETGHKGTWQVSFSVTLLVCTEERIQYHSLLSFETDCPGKLNKQ